MDLFGPSRTMIIGGNYYGLVIVDEFSRFTWTLFIITKDDAFCTLKRLNKSKMRRITLLLSLKLIMGESFKIKGLKDFVKNLELNIIF